MNGFSRPTWIERLRATLARRMAAPLALGIALAAGEPALAQSGLQPQVYDTQPSAKSAVRLQFLNTPWDEVLQKVAEETDSDLVVDQVPPGRYSRFDRAQHTRADAVRILNRELEPMGFRLMEKGEHLVLLNLRDLRNEYRRPLLPQHETGRATAPPRTSNLTPRNFTTINPRRVIQDSRIAPVVATDEPEASEPSHAARPRMTVPPAEEADASPARPVRESPARRAVNSVQREPAYHPADGDQDFDLKASARSRRQPLSEEREDQGVEPHDGVRPAAPPREYAGSARMSHPAGTRRATRDSGPAAGNDRDDGTEAYSRESERPAPEPREAGAARRTVVPPEHALREPLELRISLRRHNAVNVARILYESFGPQAELVDFGPDGLPGFRVRREEGVQRASFQGDRAGRGADDFKLGIDSEENELIVAGPPARVREIEHLVGAIDALVLRRGETARFVPMSGNVRRTAASLQETIRQMAAFNQPPLRSQRDAADGAEAESPDGVAQEAPPAAQPAPAPPVTRQIPRNGNQPPPTPPDPDAPAAAEIPSLSVRLRAPVNIQVVPGGLIVTGNREDVDAVMELIETLRLSGGGAVPNFKLVRLRHVNSEAMAELLNAVYTEISTVRTPLIGQQQQPVRAVPVVKPNALIVIASGPDMKLVEDLIEQLDQPVDPLGEVEVFRLRHGIASQVVTSIDTFYATRAPLGTRVRAFADVRTNSVVVYGRPNDLAEVARLIERIDQPTSAAVNQMRVFPLKNATATELAALINTAIQSVIRPPATTTLGQAGQQFAQQGVGAAGTGQQALQDAKSAILEFLAIDGDQQKLVRSGILADIRVTPDAGRNALIVTAPIQSLDLIAALILQLDQPTPLVAEIKVFTLSNSDATVTADLLRSLFTGQTQQAGAGGFPGQPGFPGAAGQITGGLQLAGAEGAGAGLIPLRFSVDPRTNTIIAIGSGDALQIVEAVLLRLDESDIRQRKNTVVKLKNTFANDVALAINQFLTAQRDLAQVDPNLVTSIELLEREIIVVPELVSNSLLISSTPRYYDEILKLIQQLDQKPPEVTIQALIVEVDLTNTDEYGVELGFQDRILFNRSVGGVPGFLFNNMQLGNNTAFPGSGRVGTQELTNFSLGRTNPDLGFGGLVLSASSDQVSVLIRALSSKRTVHVLSRPQIRTLDNQVAQILVGQQVPVATGVATTGLTAASPQVSLRDVGILLNVIPRISPDGTIVMEVVAQRSSLSATRVPIFTDINTGNTVDSPVINVTAAQATVSVPNGQTVILGGMITKSDDAFERKVPWLGDLPYIGNAFRYEGVNARRTELLIFLTPRVIRHEGDSEVIKRVEAERIHFIERDAEEVHGPLYSAPPPDWYLNRPDGCPPGAFPGATPGGHHAAPFVPSAPRPPFGASGPMLNDPNVPTTVMPSHPNGGVAPIPNGQRTDERIVPQPAFPPQQGPPGQIPPPKTPPPPPSPDLGTIPMTGTTPSALPGAAPPAGWTNGRATQVSYGDPSSAHLPQQTARTSFFSKLSPTR